MEDKFFSIGIPVYNAEKFLAECLDSILSQSFSDFELVLVDDGSKDNSLEICRSYEKKDNRIKAIHKENGGISSASNCALEHCTGKYIFLMDNDDIMCEDTLKNAYEKIISCNYPDVVHTYYYHNTPLGSAAHTFPYPEENYFAVNKDERLVMLYLEKKLNVCLWTKFIKNSFLKESNILFEDRFTGVQDTDVTFKIFRKADSIVFADFYSIYWIHPRENSVSSTWKLKNFKNIISFYRYYIDDAENWDISEELRSRFQDNLRAIMRNYTLEVFNMPKDDLMKVFDIIEEQFGDEFKNIKAENNKDLSATNKLIFTLYNIIGIKNTAKLLNFYLKKN